MSHHPSTISHFLDLASPFSNSLFQTSILLQTINETNNTTTHIEPLPHLDYNLLYTLIHLARPHLSKRDLKRFDYLADARKFYYQCHHKFQAAFRTLLDLSSQSEQLDARHASLTQNLKLIQSQPPADRQINAATTLTSTLHHLSLLRLTNERQTRTALADLETRRERLERACMWFSSLKWKYLHTDIGALVEIGKQIYAAGNGKRAEPLNVVPLDNGMDGSMMAEGVPA
ncbi:hypothetical protein N7G274_000931 [Stereocaulon virgatum]|uniref:Uncharacterized protein n=1 Tax=Stereocaulon virgatum TaxID=373712 RepID=A0ABR4ATY4_9LECA